MEHIYTGQKDKVKLTYKYDGRVSAGKILVIGTQGGGKTAMATQLAALTNPNIKYQEDFGGTIETEYMKILASDKKLFSLLLPIGGQEKWAKLRSAYGETAEGMIAVLDSCTKCFWKNSLSQAYKIAPRIPYVNFPFAFVISKRDLNETISSNSRQIASAIATGFIDAKKSGLVYYSRGHRIIKREIPPITSSTVPFSVGEQIIVNSLEKEFFKDLEPGNAKKGIQLLKGFSLVNCRLFSRALASAICKTESTDSMAVLSLLNDMRPTMLELDTEWSILQKKYPTAGKEPTIDMNLNNSQFEAAMMDQLLANHTDINNIVLQATEMVPDTDWKVQGFVYASIFLQKDLEKVADLVEDIMINIRNNKPAEKFNLLDPLETLF